MVSKILKDKTSPLLFTWASFVLLLIVGVFASCEKADFGDEEEEEVSKANQTLLKVKTRANSSEDVEVSYPVNVYVMDSKGTCVDYSQLDSESDVLEFSLEKGTYQVYAIAGASEDSYNVPSKDNATPSSKFVLLDNMEHGDLMSANDNVVLTKGESNTLVLTLSRRVAKIESISMEGIPVNATAVEVTLSPLAKYILLDGSNSEETISKTIQLTYNSSTGLWTNTLGYFITESNSNISIKVSITLDGAKNSYTCNYKGKVEANHKLTINGKFVDNDMSLQGVLTGAKWDDPVSIDFEVNADGSSDSNSPSQDDNTGQEDDNDDPQSGNAPSVGSLYDNCVVVKSSKSGSSTTVTLMTIDEYNKLSYSKSQKGKDNAKFQAEIASCVEETFAFFNDDKLRLPSLEELEFVYDNREAINGYIEDIDVNASLIELKGGAYYCGYYYLADDGYIYVYTLDGQIEKEPNPNRATYKVRGFKTLTFTN